MGILCVSCVAMISFYILTKIKHLYSFRLFRLLLLRATTIARLLLTLTLVGSYSTCRRCRKLSKYLLETSRSNRCSLRYRCKTVDRFHQPCSNEERRGADSRDSMSLEHFLVFASILRCPSRIGERERSGTRKREDDFGLISFSNIDDDRITGRYLGRRDRMNVFDAVSKEERSASRASTNRFKDSYVQIDRV